MCRSLNDVVHVPLATSYSRVCASDSTALVLPSGEKHSTRTELSLPKSTHASCAPDTTSHSLIVESSPPDASVAESGENATVVMKAR